MSGTSSCMGLDLKCSLECFEWGIWFLVWLRGIGNLPILPNDYSILINNDRVLMRWTLTDCMTWRLWWCTVGLGSTVATTLQSSSLIGFGSYLTMMLSMWVPSVCLFVYICIWNFLGNQFCINGLCGITLNFDPPTENRPLGDGGILRVDIWDPEVFRDRLHPFLPGPGSHVTQPPRTGGREVGLSVDPWVGQHRGQ